MGHTLTMILIVATICWLAGFALLWTVPVCGESTADEQSDSGEQPMRPSVCIIIPARNEEATLPRLLASIREQDWRPAHVLVIDDDSTDQTVAVAQAGGATVVSSGVLPQGWRGKTWACRQGAAAAQAMPNVEHLLFLDADTWFEPGGLRRIMQTHLRQSGALSALPYVVVPSAREQLSAYFNLIMALGIGAFNLFSKEPDGMFGQMLLMDCDAYFRVGGHERVRGNVLENLHLARYLRAQGIILRCVSGRGSLSMRMYAGGLRDMVEGWTKGFASGAGATSRPIMGLTIIWLSGATLAAATLLQMHGLSAAGVYAIFAGQLYFMFRRIGSFHFISAILYPIPLLFFFAVFANSMLRSGRKVVWKGRAIRAD